MKIKILLVLLLFVVTGCSTAVAAKNSKQVKFVFFDIGQGDASFVEFENGQQLLIDCSIDARILESLGNVMSYYDRKIDYLFITHPDQDHYGGCVDVMKRFEIGTIVYTGFKKQNQFFLEFEKTMNEEIASGATYIEITEPKEFIIASSTVKVLYPNVPVDELPLKSANESSLVIQIRHNDISAIFMGDAEEEVEEYLINIYGKEFDHDILKVGHHGSSGGTSKHFLEYIQPKYAIISAGKDNSYGHPSRRVLRKLERVQAKILRTDVLHDIILYIQDEEIKME
jgi:competence protein ComEC